MDTPSLSISVHGKAFQLEPTKHTDQVQQGNEKKRAKKKRKRPRKKASNKSTKSSGGKGKTLQAPLPVNGAVAMDSTDHAGVKANVSVGGKKTGKKRVKPNKVGGSSVPRKKQKRAPAKSRKTVGNGNLNPPLNATAHDVLGEKSGNGLDRPRESDQSGKLGQLTGAQPDGVDQKKAHDGDRKLQEKPEAEVAEQHVPVFSDIEKSTLINWEHFSLAYEEYCLTKEVSKN